MGISPSSIHVKMTWEDTAGAEKARLEASIPQEWRVTIPQDVKSTLSLPQETNVLTETELQITNTSATELVKQLGAGQLTSVAVTTAFCKRAALAHQAVNCLHDFFPDAALARAKELDQYLAEHGKPVGPLHGAHLAQGPAARQGPADTHGVHGVDQQGGPGLVRHGRLARARWCRLLHQDERAAEPDGLRDH